MGALSALVAEGADAKAPSKKGGVKKQPKAPSAKPKAAPPKKEAPKAAPEKQNRKLSLAEDIKIDHDNFEKEVHDHKNVWVVLFTSKDKEACPHCAALDKVWSEFKKSNKGVKFGTC